MTRTDKLLLCACGDKDYDYNATPDELYAFLAAGSLGKEMNAIKQGNSHSLRRL